MRLYIPLICTILVCLTACYIWNDYKKQHAYEYVTTRIGDADRIIKIKRSDQTKEYLKYTNQYEADWYSLGDVSGG